MRGPMNGKFNVFVYTRKALKYNFNLCKCFEFVWKV
jgi:hypothetical protein